MMMTMNSMINSCGVKFQGVQLVMDTQSMAPRENYEKQFESIRKRIRGNIEVFGYDREVCEAAERELGPQPDYNSIKASLERRSKAFVEQKRQENAQDPSYQGLLFDHGFYPNPKNPESKSQQMLYIDGADVQRFKQEMADEMFAQTRDLGFYEDRQSAVRRVDTRRLTGADSIVQSLVKKWANDCLTQYQAGQTDKILDLDA
jgi:hypothetical protein